MVWQTGGRVRLRTLSNLRWMAVIAHDAGAAPAAGTAPARSDSFEQLFADSADRPRRGVDPLAKGGHERAGDRRDNGRSAAP